MKYIVGFCFVLLTFSSLIGQSFKKEAGIENGRYNVGYRDTVIYDSSEIFSFNDYLGIKPYFLHIWYPSYDKTKTRTNFQFQNYWDFHTTEQNEELLKNIKSIYCDQTFNAEEFPNVILNQPVLVHYKGKLIKNKLPIILYHHGSQGIGLENTKLCEYFASHGYIVISPNFSLPSDLISKLIPSSGFKTQFNLAELTPENMESIETMMNNAELKNIDFILNFIKESPEFAEKKIVGIGHSHGAQRLFLSDKDISNRFDKIIALHTLYEEDDPNEICEIRPFDCQVLNDNLNYFTTPTFFIAPFYLKNEKIIKPDFSFHQKFPSANCIALNSTMEHNAFISDWLTYAIDLGIVPKERTSDYYEVLKICLCIVKNKKLKSTNFRTVLQK
jgi:hypothetical protein